MKPNDNSKTRIKTQSVNWQRSHLFWCDVLLAVRILRNETRFGFDCKCARLFTDEFRNDAIQSRLWFCKKKWDCIVCFGILMKVDATKWSRMCECRLRPTHPLKHRNRPKVGQNLFHFLFISCELFSDARNEHDYCRSTYVKTTIFGQIIRAFIPRWRLMRSRAHVISDCGRNQKQ